MAKNKERTSLSGRHATGNTHRHATRKKPKGKYPIQNGENISKRKEAIRDKKGTSK